MIADIHKLDTSTLVTTGRFYFAWTLVVNDVSSSMTLAVSQSWASLRIVRLQDRRFSVCSPLVRSLKICRKSDLLKYFAWQ